jgi:DNA primase large subunit
MRISDYPFTREAAEQVRSMGTDLDALLDRPGFRSVRARAAERVLGAMGSEISLGYDNPDVELLSYPLARVMASCLGDDFLLKRYALAEAKLAFRRMLKEKDILPLARDLGYDLHGQKEPWKLHFCEYVKAAHRMRSPKWRLVNRDLQGGELAVTREELLRLMEETVRDRVLKGLPLELEEEICARLVEHLRPLRSRLDSLKARQRVDLGRVTEGAFPPCMKSMLKQVASGANLAHSARFALVSFLLRVNMSPEEVVGIFNTSPDFDEERTRYQVEHIAGSSGTRYRPPSCATMITYGNCPGEDDLCRRIRHPLGYYERRLRSP